MQVFLGSPYFQPQTYIHCQRRFWCLLAGKKVGISVVLVHILIKERNEARSHYRLGCQCWGGDFWSQWLRRSMTLPVAIVQRVVQGTRRHCKVARLISFSSLCGQFLQRKSVITASHIWRSCSAWLRGFISKASRKLIVHDASVLEMRARPLSEIGADA